MQPGRRCNGEETVSNNRKILALLGTTAFCLFTTGEAVAQEKAADGYDTLEAIVVTARKREESLQETPISISAFTAEALNVKGVTNFDKVEQFTPSLVLREFPGNSAAPRAAIFIRGIGANDFAPTMDPAVGVYVDGVYLGRNVGSVLDLLDVERIEVLRGPQGTLFGRNNIGGAISLTSKKPVNRFEGNADVRFGTDNRLNVRGTVNVPLGDTLYARFSVASYNQDGYIKRIQPDGFADLLLGNDNTDTMRAALRWVPSSEIEVNLAFDMTSTRENGPPLATTSIDPNGFAIAFANAGSAPGVDCFAASAANNKGCYNLQWVDPKHKANFGTDPSYQRLDSWGGALTIDWDLSDNLQLRSLTSYRDSDGEFALDGDGSPIRVAANVDTWQQHQFTQELQFVGKAFDDRFKWVAGLYYFREKGENINPVRFSIVEIQSGGYFKSESIAGFAQGTYTFADSFDLTAGLRYTDERRDYLPDQYITHDPLGFGGVGARVVPYVTVTAKYNKLVPLVSLAYRPSEGTMVYATYTEGFRSGGFTQRIFPPELSLPRFAPEKVKSYEGGAKFTGLNNRLRLNVAGYFTRYADMQLLASDPSRVGPFVANAGDADIWGFEAETSFIPGDGWMIEGNLGYVDPQRTSVSGGVIGLTTDSRFEHISKWTANVQLSKHTPLPGGGALTPRFEWAYRSGYGTSAANVPRPILPPSATGGVPQPALYQGGFSLVNASLRWDVRDYDVAVTLGVDNLTDKHYRTMGDYAASFGYSLEVFDRGRQWYASVAYKF